MLRLLPGLAVVLLIELATAHWPNIQLVHVHHQPPGDNEFRAAVVSICRAIPPGTCCIPHRQELLQPRESLSAIAYGATGFSVLLGGQIGFGWGATGPDFEDIRCDSGNPILRLAGPNQDSYDPWDEEGGYIALPPGGLRAEEPATPAKIVFAASWIDLRRRFPPNSADSRYLQWQGVKGLLWGSGRWTPESGGIPFPRRHRRYQMTSSTPHGTAYLRATRRWRRPDLYRIKGIDWTVNGDGVYMAEDGRSLNFTIATN